MGPQILNDTKKNAKSASWGKCQVREEPVRGCTHQNLLANIILRRRAVLGI